MYGRMSSSFHVALKPAAPAHAMPGENSQRRGALPALIWLLALAGLVDWLVTRTITRFAIFIPKTPAMIVGYQVLGWVGQVGSTVAALLALVSLAWIMREEWRARRIPWLGLSMAALAVLSVVFVLTPAGKWLLVYHLVVLSVLCGLAWRMARVAAPWANRWAGLLPATAMIAAALYQAAPTVYTVLRLPGPPAGGAWLFRAGEGLVVISAAALWWAYGGRSQRRAWVVGALPALAFAAAYLHTPAMTATIVIWSTGLTLFLPWWSYAIALWLCGVTVLHMLQRGEHWIACAIVLLAASGYAPQLSSQLIFGLVALWLLTHANDPECSICAGPREG